MCPLRIILIFLSATLAGILVIRNLKSTKSQIDNDADNASVNSTSSDSVDTAAIRSAKVCAAIQSGFWTCVDMCSGRYLWRLLVKSPSNKPD